MLKRERLRGLNEMSVASRIAFTICSWNYMAYALTLRASFLEHNADIRFCIFIADTPQPDVAAALPDVEICVVDSLIAPPYRRMADIYSIMEYNTSVKPFVFEYIYDHLGIPGAIYLDPDILVTASLEHLYELLENGNEALLTPHITKPLDDGFHPGDLDILRCGVYNLGFIALYDSIAVRLFVDWWRRWLTADCVVALEDGIFVDQKFCDMVPAFVAKTRVLHDLGYNLAYWNLSQRELTADEEGGLTVGNDTVKFVHFSGVNKDKPDEFSKHQNRFSRRTIGLLGPVFDDYVRRLQANDILVSNESGGPVSISFSKLPYGFAETFDGLPGGDIVKQCIKRYRREVGHRPISRPFDQSFFVEPSEKISADGGVAIGRLLAEVYLTRQDLKHGFDCSTREGRLQITRWAVDHFAEEYNVPIEWVVDSPLLSNVAEQAEILPPEPLEPAPARVPKASILQSLGRRLRRAPIPGSLVDGTDANLTTEVPSRSRHGLAIYGFFRTESGVGQSARNLTDAFQTSGMPFSAHALLPPHADNNVAYACTPPQAGDLDHALLVINADNVGALEQWMDPAYIEPCRKIGFFVWELPVFPAIWSGAVDKVDEIWVPTEFVATSLKSATYKPVHVVPYPVPIMPPLDRIEARSSFGLPADRIVFLVTFDFNSFPERKNPFAALRAFIDAFPKETDETPLLVIKFHGTHNRGNYLMRMRSLARGRSDVIFIDAVYTTLQMQRLQAAADVYVSLHRSEGFGLNLAECMSIGKTVIGTAFSGNLDFMKGSNSLLIDYDVQPILEGEYVAWHGQWWADPHHDQAVEAMRMAAHSDDTRRRLGEAARQTIAEDLALQTIGRRMASLVDTHS